MPSVAFKKPFGIKVSLQAAVNFSVAAMVLSTDCETVNNCPGYVFFAFANPLTTGVIFVSDGVKSAIFLVETPVVKELFAEASCQKLGVFQSHFDNEFVWEVLGGLVGAVVGYKQVHGVVLNR
jgi:hypothetical protein